MCFIPEFQSYYSLIFNKFTEENIQPDRVDFNPIIVLFLTDYLIEASFCEKYFNPIIVLFLTSVQKTVLTENTISILL